MNDFKLVAPKKWSTNGRSGIKLFSCPVLQVSASMQTGYADEQATGTALLLTNEDRMLKRKDFSGPILLVVERLIEDWAAEETKKVLDILAAVGYK